MKEKDKEQEIRELKQQLEKMRATDTPIPDSAK